VGVPLKGGGTKMMMVLRAAGLPAKHGNYKQQVTNTNIDTLILAQTGCATRKN
jgi:hypothetical protein